MKNNKHFIIAILILLAVMVISLPSYLIVPKGRDEAFVSRFPLKVGGWEGRDLEVDERAYEILETRNLILREYSKGDEKIYLYIIYSQDNRKVSHPPEVCFEGSGVTIVKKDKIRLNSADNRVIPANRLIVEKGGASNIVVYWYKAGDYYTDNYLKQQLKIALARLRFKRTSGALIRLTAEVAPDHPERALEDIQAFTKEAYPYFQKIIP